MASATLKGPHWGELVPDTPWAARAREDKRTKERTAPIADEIGSQGLRTQIAASSSAAVPSG